MLTPRALTTLNGFNSRQLHRITERSYREEATTPSYDPLDGRAKAEAPVAGPHCANARPQNSHNQRTTEIQISHRQYLFYLMDVAFAVL